MQALGESAAVIQPCRSLCKRPHARPLAGSTTSRCTSRIVGRWLRCGGGSGYSWGSHSRRPLLWHAVGGACTLTTATATTATTAAATALPMVAIVGNGAVRCRCGRQRHGSGCRCTIWRGWERVVGQLRRRQHLLYNATHGRKHLRSMVHAPGLQRAGGRRQGQRVHRELRRLGHAIIITATASASTSAVAIIGSRATNRRRRRGVVRQA